ncbi:MAG: hypothetical protein H6853_05260 [Rhodospirillales bacterium]|nr:hypothetical protein [Alphaproteobacteria bacterium]USO02959.1 MAG: hypothetical protein H6853_05260 [Rhodospirillales bacterium]
MAEKETEESLDPLREAFAGTVNDAFDSVISRLTEQFERTSRDMEEIKELLGRANRALDRTDEHLRYLRSGAGCSSAFAGSVVVSRIDPGERHRLMEERRHRIDPGPLRLSSD